MDNDTFIDNPTSTFVSAVDISSLPEIQDFSPKFYNSSGTQEDFLSILKNNGVNTIRLRLWVKPENNHSSFEEVKQFSSQLKNRGLKIWLTLHYSDTWADPSQQEIPSEWKNQNISELQESVYNYTKKVVSEIQPNYIQIGNEINAGLLHPTGNISDNTQNFLDLIRQGVAAVRNHSSNCKIILHFAGIENSTWFFNQVKNIDYDIIGLSYYPKWHGKSLSNLKSKMIELSNSHNKEILIAETAYPFTLDWNDWTNNIVGLEEHLILPEYPATASGQQKFISDIKQVIKEVEMGIGFCYWGGELIAWKGEQGTEASPWENQALFNFNNKALPVLLEFQIE
ncbi:MAG: arabinogalactan endo-1,4-beta-galactosidase [Tenacibaculum sp.]|nr:arabinogalactan endo-1,4-beta-galactosidase [Tenacibaculum sp.]